MRQPARLLGGVDKLASLARVAWPRASYRIADLSLGYSDKVQRIASQRGDLISMGGCGFRVVVFTGLAVTGYAVVFNMATTRDRHQASTACQSFHGSTMFLYSLRSTSVRS